jgi:hypothetical protein
MLWRNITNGLASIPRFSNCWRIRPTSNPSHVETTATLAVGEVVESRM